MSSCCIAVVPRRGYERLDHKRSSQIRQAGRRLTMWRRNSGRARHVVHIEQANRSDSSKKTSKGCVHYQRRRWKLWWAVSNSKFNAVEGGFHWVQRRDVVCMCVVLCVNVCWWSTWKVLKHKYQLILKIFSRFKVINVDSHSRPFIWSIRQCCIYSSCCELFANRWG